jgi:hypothetical protein
MPATTLIRSILSIMAQAQQHLPQGHLARRFDLETVVIFSVSNCFILDRIVARTVKS